MTAIAEIPWWLEAGDAIPGFNEILIPVTIGVLAGILAEQMIQAHQQAQALKPTDQAQPCVECGEIPCFNVPDGGDPAEMASQLKDQEDLINSLSPDEMQQRLDEAAARKAKTGSYRSEGDSDARQKARNSYQDEQTEKLIEQNKAAGMDPEKAETEAQKQVAKDMTGKDATHALDSIVGAKKGDPIGMGDSSTNRSIGSQWKTRLQALKNAVAKAKAASKKKMDIKLEICDQGVS